MQKTAAPITTYLLGYAVGSRDADPEETEHWRAGPGPGRELGAGGDAPDPDDIDDEVPDDSGVDHAGEDFTRRLPARAWSPCAP